MDNVAKFLQEHANIVNEILMRGNDVSIERRKNGLVIVEKKSIIYN